MPMKPRCGQPIPGAPTIQRASDSANAVKAAKSDMKWILVVFFKRILFAIDPVVGRSQCPRTRNLA